MQPIRILLVDDHAMFRSGLSLLLRSRIPDVQMQEAAAVAEVLHGDMEAPDVMLLDVMLRGLNGLDGVPLLKRKWPQTPIVVLSSDTAPETARSALARGATAFVSKEKTAEDILSVVMQVLALVPAAGHALAECGEPAAAEPRLTPRQCEVLDLLCQGLPNKVIGRKLDLSENTVRGHVQAILTFLQVSNRSEAAFVARQKGLIR